MERKYYEAYDDRYRQVHGEGLQWFHDDPTPIVMETVKEFQLTQVHRLLELGCGEGRDAYILLQQGYDLLPQIFLSRSSHLPGKSGRNWLRTSGCLTVFPGKYRRDSTLSMQWRCYICWWRTLTGMPFTTLSAITSQTMVSH